MLITQPALLYLRATFQPFKPSLALISDQPRLDGDANREQRSDALPTVPETGEIPVAALESAEKFSPEGTRRHVANLDGPLTVRERRARAAALRALALSRTRRFSGAREAFIEASELDPQLDLTRVPMFWSLERAAHEAAIDAYVMTGRADEAVVLRARIRSTYRPRSLPGQSKTRALMT